MQTRINGAMAPRPAQDPGIEAFLDAEGIDRAGLGQLLLDATGEGIVVVGPGGAVVFANPAARERLGIEPGASLREALPEVADAVERAMASREEQPGPLVRRRTASHLTKATPLCRGGELLGVLCVLVDVTAAAELATRQLWAYEELTREQDAIINSTTEGLWICDGDANVLRVNPASERLNGIRADQVVGRNMRDLMQEGFLDRSATLEVIKTRAPVNMLQMRQGRKLVLTGNPVFDDTGKLIRVVVNERDITEIDGLQRELEEQEAMRDRFRDQILEMQLETVESRRVIAKSPCMQKALRQAIKVSAADSTVLVLGESGVGKGLFADLIHKYSPRKDKPLVKVNCGAIPESLVEAELFGYEKGAFTGAQARGRAGYFEAAAGGTLFLDEVAELPLSSQVKLLRFLEDRRITRVGATASREVDVRVLAATHRDLNQMVEAGAFRLDLFYRLNVIPLAIPPLRERAECLLPVLRHYVEYYAQRVGTRRRLSRAATDALLAYRWPGNVRELMNLCERLVVMSDSEVIDLADLPPQLTSAAAASPAPGAAAWDGETTLEEALLRTERAVLLRARERYRSQTDMARALGVNQSTVARKLQRHGL
jgi:PAS domain S-box-containing protein